MVIYTPWYFIDDHRIDRWRHFRQTRNELFVDTNSDIIQSLFGSKQRPKEGYVIQVSYDIINGMLLCKNISSESKNCGKEIICCSNINTLKRYKLTILLDKPSTITMF